MFMRHVFALVLQGYLYFSFWILEFLWTKNAIEQTVTLKPLGYFTTILSVVAHGCSCTRSKSVAPRHIP